MIDPPAAPEVICNLMHRCWAANPADRPRFSEIVVELTSRSPVTVRCRGEDRQEPQWDVPVGASKLEVVDGDIIAVIDGRYALTFLKDFYFYFFLFKANNLIFLCVKAGFLLVDWAKSAYV